jgi:hypothetical protein
MLETEVKKSKILKLNINRKFNFKLHDYKIESELSANVYARN